MNESDGTQKLDLGVSILAHKKHTKDILNTTILKRITKGKNEIYIIVTILACSGFIRMPGSTACLVRLYFNGAFAGRPVTPC